MNQKRTFSIAIGLLLLLASCTRSNQNVAQQPTKPGNPLNTDAPADSLTRAYLSTLQPVKQTDTSLAHLTLQINGKKYKATDFIDAENYRNTLIKQQKQPKLVAPKFRSRFAPFLQLSASQTALEAFILQLRAKAIPICGDHANFNDGKTPKQSKIAYVWGSKDYSTRSQPTGDCAYKAYGLDCSGFVYQVFKQNNVIFSVSDCNAEHERQTTYLDKFLKPLNFHVQDLGKITSFATGDLIYFLNAKTKQVSHIGIVLLNDQNIASIFMTSGGTECSNNANCCTNNLNGGPKILQLPKITSDGRAWGVVRLQTN